MTQARRSVPLFLYHSSCASHRRSACGEEATGLWRARQGGHPAGTVGRTSNIVPVDLEAFQVAYPGKGGTRFAFEEFSTKREARRVRKAEKRGSGGYASTRSASYPLALVDAQWMIAENDTLSLWRMGDSLRHCRAVTIRGG